MLAVRALRAILYPMQQQARTRPGAGGAREALMGRATSSLAVTGGLVAASVVAWLAVWVANDDGLVPHSPGAWVLAAAFVALAVLFGAGVVRELLGLGADRTAEAVVAVAVTAIACAVAALVLGGADPLLLGAVWSVLVLGTLRALLGRSAGQRDLAVLVVVWIACLAVWWLSESPGPTDALLWIPSDSVHYTLLASEVSDGVIGESPWLLGVPLFLQPVAWALGSGGPDWLTEANAMNEALLVPMAVVVMPALLLLVARCTTFAVGALPGAGDPPGAGDVPRTGDLPGRVGATFGGVVMAVVLTAYGIVQPAFIHEQTGVSAARRMVGVATGPETLSLVFAGALLLLVAAAVRGRTWSPALVGVAIALGVMVRETNAVLAAIAVVALLTIPGAWRRVLATGAVAAVAFVPQLVAWQVGWGTILAPNRTASWEGSDAARMWRDLVVERYGVRFDGDPPTTSLSYFRVNFEHWWPQIGPALVLVTVLGIALLVLRRDQTRLWLVCLVTLWSTFLFNTCYINVTPQYRYNVVALPAVAVIVAAALVVLVRSLRADRSAPEAAASVAVGSDGVDP